MEVSTSFDTLSQSLSRHGNGSVVSGGGGQASAKRRRREDQLESLRSTLRSLRSYQAEEAMATGNTSTLESRGTLRGAGAYPPMAATATVGGRRSFSRPPRPPSTAVAPSVASSSAPGPPPVPLDVIAAVHEVMGAPSQSEFRGLGSTLSGGSRLTSRRGSGCSSGGGTLRRAASTSMDRKRRSSYASNSRLSSAGYV